MRFLTILGTATALLGIQAVSQAQVPDFNREVRPILSQKCFRCHGPDDGQRKAGLRLDDRSIAVGKLLSGHRAIVAGKPDQSEAVKRMHATGAGIMPPVTLNKPLSEAEKKVLEKWIAAGAEYKTHWAFVAPKQAPLPEVKQKSWPRNPIDHFVLARLEKEGLHPSPEADKYTLIRRLSLDLIGLPPTPEEVDAFVKDTRPYAYSRLVDRLFASPHYGERWARRWLDLARYADTNGYEKDRQRSIWPFRDWVINALNRDVPFNQFTIEQLAGDMLPNATMDQRVATGFHRNTMLNEEGGIDPQEFRFYSLVDRTATTGTTWLGMTVGCAQCHTHKYDPITHKDYYRMMAFFNNADEPEVDVVRGDIAAKRAEVEARVAAMEADLPNRFPVKRNIAWSPLKVASATSEAGAHMGLLPDGSVLVSGVNPDKDVYTITLDGVNSDATDIRLETLTDPSLGSKGPGRTPHGNFVLSYFGVTIDALPIKLTSAEADFSQDEFSAMATLDPKTTKGWAISGTGNWNVDRTISYRIAAGSIAKGTQRIVVTLKQNYGGHHTIGRFRISLGRDRAASQNLNDSQNRERFNSAFADWRSTAKKQAIRWTPLRPTKLTSNSPLLTVLGDNSVLSSGDITKRDVFEAGYKPGTRGITAIRLEAIPDDSLPRHGPGRVFYEGGPGDFFLSEINVEAGGAPIKIAKVTQSIGNAALTIDGNPQTGWSVSGGQTQTHSAIFTFDKPVNSDDLNVKMVFEQYYAASIGRFRISVTTDDRALSAGIVPDVEEILLMPEASWSGPQRDRLTAYFASIAPELQSARAEIQAVRAQMPNYSTTLAFEERPKNNPRTTYVRNRGEYLQQREAVTASTFAFLPSIAKSEPSNRLAFAKWLVNGTNPLVGRVTMNRQWAAFFGRGIVPTTEDFGFQGQPPTHPELLDWLAVEFVKQKWSMKAMHKLIVMSATYRQSSRVAPKLKQRDPQNRLLARGPRVRLDAELVRDFALTASGLLSQKMFGPSVFPPQPPGVTSEGTYGPLQWRVSEGEDRYRRGLYTFSKRTAPYAMFTTFDAPSGEACLARREVSNTPLQALAMLNDTVFTESAQALGRMMAARKEPDVARIGYLFMRCLTRPPSPSEFKLMASYLDAQRARFASKQLNAMDVAGPGEGDAVERAVWTVLARSVLNLDEAITKR